MYQAKDIQQILRIPKIRYEYLANQIGIVPEIEEGEGTGKAHKYSFRNLLEFSIAERCSLNGLSMRQVKFFITLLHEVADPKLFAQPDWFETSKPNSKRSWKGCLLCFWGFRGEAFSNGAIQRGMG